MFQLGTESRLIFNNNNYCNYSHNMEGQTIVSNNLKFIETNKSKVGNELEHLSYNLIAVAHELNLILVADGDRVSAVSASDLTIKFNINVRFRPTLLSVAREGFSTLLVASGVDKQTAQPTIQIIDLKLQDTICSLKLPLNNDLVTDHSWHPEFSESILALCTLNGNLLIVGISQANKAVKLLYSTQKYGCSSCCWSPKGKNLAVGLSNGKVIRLEPIITNSDLTIKEVEKSLISFNHISQDYRFIKLRWINKKYLIAVHSKPGSTIHTMFSIKGVSRFWNNVCYENSDVHQANAYILNLTNSVVCSSSASGEAATIGLSRASEVGANDLNCWNVLIVDEEGARIELPLDSNNSETYFRGAATLFSNQNNPMLVFYTSCGMICLYSAVHSENILQQPELQSQLNLPIQITQPRQIEPITPPSEISIQQRPTLAQTVIPSIPQPTQQPSLTDHSQTVHKSYEKSKISVVPREIIPKIDLSNEISEVKKSIEFNEVFLSLFDDVNHLRGQLDEVLEIHQAHREVLNAIKEDIDSLDIGMLENLYLVEYIKARPGKKSVDPLTLKKVESFKQKLKPIAEKLTDLNLNVDVSWEEFVRRKTGVVKLNSLDMIFKTLATNQKIINVLKKKASSCQIDGASNVAPVATFFAPVSKEQDPKRIRSFRKFLASRGVVPVRRPYRVK